MPVEEEVNEEFITLLSKQSLGLSGAEVALIPREAGMLALQENIEALKVTKENVKEGKKRKGDGHFFH